MLRSDIAALKPDATWSNIKQLLAFSAGTKYEVIQWVFASYTDNTDVFDRDAPAFHHDNIVEENKEVTSEMCYSVESSNSYEIYHSSERNDETSYNGFIKQ